MTIAVAALLETEELRTALRGFEGFRSLRSGIECGWQSHAFDEDVRRAVEVVRAMLVQRLRAPSELRPVIAEDRISAVTRAGFATAAAPCAGGAPRGSCRPGGVAFPITATAAQE
jgi:hypothetical protein